MPPLIPDELAEFFESGVSILAGTCSAAGRPECVRAYGALVHADRQHIRMPSPILAGWDRAPMRHPLLLGT